MPLPAESTASAEEEGSRISTQQRVNDRIQIPGGDPEAEPPDQPRGVLGKSLRCRGAMTSMTTRFPARL